MEWLDDEAENQRIYEQSLHPEGIKKTIKMRESTGKRLDVVSNVFSINKENFNKEMHSNTVSKIVNIIAMIIIVSVFLVIIFGSY